MMAMREMTVMYKKQLSQTPTKVFYCNKESDLACILQNKDMMHFGELKLTYVTFKL